MKCRLCAVAFCVAGVFLSIVASSGRADHITGELRGKLVGTWKMKSMTINGEKNDLPETAVTYKHVTPGGFVWLSYAKDTGEMFRAGGGTWTIAGDAYTEKIEYGLGGDLSQIKNGSHVFKCRIEGDTWYHVGKLADGTTIDEQWTRVKPAEAAAATTAAEKQPAAAKQP